VVATLAVGLAVAAPAVADVNEITVARRDDPVGTETLRVEHRHPGPGSAPSSQLAAWR